MGLQCNVRCTMCYQTDFSAQSNMPDELWRDRLLAVYPHVRSVKLQGGEPTVMKNCRAAATFLRGYPNAKIEIISNGIFIDDFWHETLVEQGRLYSVSIQGATADVYDKIVIHGNHERVIHNLQRVLKHRRGTSPKVLLTAVVLKENCEHLSEIIGLAGRLGADGVEFTYDPILSFRGLPTRDRMLTEIDRCEAAAGQFPDVSVGGLDPLYWHAGKTRAAGGCIDKGMCRAPFANLVVDWGGGVRVCCNTWMRAGNLYRDSIEEIWNGPVFTAFRGKMMEGNYNWCSPDCEDNAAPSRLSLANKYLYELRTNPRHFAQKVEQKLSQLKGTWTEKLRTKSRRSKARPALPPVLK